MTMPMLSVIVKPLFCAMSRRARTLPTTFRATSSPVSGMSRANSSPPSRPTTSVLRILFLILSAIWLKSLSPSP